MPLFASYASRPAGRIALLACALLLARCHCGQEPLKPLARTITLHADAVDFGAVAVGSTAARKAVIHVDGTGTVKLSEPHWKGAGVPFAATLQPVSVQAPGTAEVALTYAPSEVGEHADTLLVTTDLDDGQTAEVEVHGRAVLGCTDADGDGYGDGCTKGPDCDDANPAVHPGAAEACGNGHDDDCDPATSDTCPPACVDADGDGYGANCAQGPDCDDANAAVHPGAAETCGNGADDDCDPSTSDTCPPACVDADGDGYGQNCASGPDCDDERASVHPGRDEVCGNGLDDDCNQATSDGCPAVACASGHCGKGCADGQREAFVDETRYPGIAGCAGGWSVPGIARETAPACARQAGDDSANPAGAGCNASDLCAAGWHVCATALDVASHSVDGCRGTDATPDSFFATRQSGNGCAQCSVSSNPADLCSGDTCLTSCYPTSDQTNDVFGCGTIGASAGSSCAPLDRFGHNLCGSLPAPWSCPGGGEQEALQVMKSGPEAGGVLCCAD